MTEAPAKFWETASRFLLPSARDIIFVFLFWSLLAGTLATRPLADPDIGWHIRTGERILLTHILPRTDPYSSIMQGKPWFAWEWLFDLLLGILHHICGLNGVVWLCAVIVSSTFILLLSQLLARGTGLALSVALMLVAECAATIHLYARPHIVSWLFVLLWFIALERWEQGSAPHWLPWFFPASMLLWVNLHGEWVFGLALLAIYTFAAFVEGWRSKDAFAAVQIEHRAWKMVRWGAASIAATFLNPFGWRLHEHIYRYLGDRYLMNLISEFRSPNFHDWPPRCFAIILVLTLFAFAGRKGRVRLSHLLLVLLATYAALFSSRNLPVSSMLLVLVIGPMLWESFGGLAASPRAWTWMRARFSRMVEFSDRMSAQEMRLHGHLWPVVVAIGALVVCLQGGRVGSHQLIHAQFDPKSVPVAATDFLEKESDTEPVFSTDSWGGYLIYRLYPRRLVVSDDRHDLYGPARVRQVLGLMQGHPGWQDVLDKLQVQTVLLPADSTLPNLLRLQPQDWSLKYEDHVAVVFERRTR